MNSCKPNVCVDTMQLYLFDHTILGQSDQLFNHETIIYLFKLICHWKTVLLILNIADQITFGAYNLCL